MDRDNETFFLWGSPLTRLAAEQSTTFDFTGENYNCSITLHLEPLHVVLLGQTV